MENNNNSAASGANDYELTPDEQDEYDELRRLYGPGFDLEIDNVMDTLSHLEVVERPADEENVGQFVLPDEIKLASPEVYNIDRGYSMLNPERVEIILSACENYRDHPPDLSTFEKFCDFLQQPIDQALRSAIADPVVIVPAENPHDRVIGKPPSTVHQKVKQEALRNITGQVLLVACTSKEIIDFHYRHRDAALFVTKTVLEDGETLVLPPGVTPISFHDLMGNGSFRESFDTIYASFWISSCNTTWAVYRVLDSLWSWLKHGGEILFFRPVNDEEDPTCAQKVLVKNHYPGCFARVVTRANDGTSYMDYSIPAKVIDDWAEIKQAHFSPVPFESYGFAKEIGFRAVLCSIIKIDLAYVNSKISHSSDILCFTYADQTIKKDLPRSIIDGFYASCSPLSNRRLSRMQSTFIVTAPKLDGLNVKLFSHNESNYAMLRNGDLFKVNPHDPTKELWILPKEMYHAEIILTDFTFGHHNGKIGYTNFYGHGVVFDYPYRGGITRRLLQAKLQHERYNNILSFCTVQEFKYLEDDFPLGQDLVVADLTDPYALSDKGKLYSPVYYVKSIPTYDVKYKNLKPLDPRINAHNDSWIRDSVPGYGVVTPEDLFEVNREGRILRRRFDKDQETDPSSELFNPPASDDTLRIIARTNLNYASYWQVHQAVTSPRFELKTLYCGNFELNYYNVVRDPATMEKVLATYPWPIISDTLSKPEMLQLYRIRHAKLHSIPESYDFFKAIVVGMMELTKSTENFKSKRKPDDKGQGKL